MAGHSLPLHPDTAPSMARVVGRNIEALLAQRRQEDSLQSVQGRIADLVTGFAGSLPFVYIHLAGFGLWIAVNLGSIPFPRFDPTFVILAMFASVEAIFLSTFILITQNRMQALADRRADLNLQISLLSEHEVTRLIHLVSSIAERMGVDTSVYPELNELKQDMAPEQVLDKIQATEQQFNSKDA